MAAPAAPNAGPSLFKWMLGLAIIGAVANALLMMKMQATPPGPPPDCTKQRQPVEPLYPRLTCDEARIELDRVARGDASPRPIVLRPINLTLDARDPAQPATLICDGVEFQLLSPNQGAPEPIVYHPGPHAVLVEERADGRLQNARYAICGNIIGGERRGRMDP